MTQREIPEDLRTVVERVQSRIDDDNAPTDEEVQQLVTEERKARLTETADDPPIT
jgi:hypothetical protein